MTPIFNCLFHPNMAASQRIHPELLTGHRCAVPRRRERKGAGAAAGSGPGTVAKDVSWGENGDVTG